MGFDYTSSQNMEDGINQKKEGELDGDAQDEVEEEEEESEFINVDDKVNESFIGISVENEHEITMNKIKKEKEPGYGSISHSMQIEDDNVPQRSRINAFVDNIQSVKDKISSLSVSSLKS